MSDEFSLSLLKLPFALAIVIALILLVGYLLRRYGPFSGSIPKRRHGQRRLSIQETLIVDGKHRLLLVRRDDKDHLILVGGPNDLLIESDITPPPSTDEGAPGQGHGQRHGKSPGQASTGSEPRETHSPRASSAPFSALSPRPKDGPADDRRSDDLRAAPHFASGTSRHSLHSDSNGDQDRHEPRL